MERSATRGRGVGVLVAAAGAVASASRPALAINRVWLNPVSGLWITNANWNPAGFPTSGDTATIDVASASRYTVTLANGVSALSGFTLNHANATLLVGAGGQLGMAGPINLTAGTLSVNGGSLAGTGAFTLGPGATLKTFSNVTMPAGMTYSLNGAIVAEGTLQGFPAAGVTNNGSITMTGAGLAWLFAPPLTNNGAITADGVGGGTARLQSSITTTLTGSITMNADTEWRGAPHTNSGAITLAAGKTLTVGSFAGVHQNAGSMTVHGSYGHVNGSFNMNGGTLGIAPGGSFLKDGGSFNYNGGTITGSPTLHNVSLTLNPPATNAASFIARGAGNSLSGEVSPNVSIRVEATGAEQASVSGGFGGIVNRGLITLAPTEQQQAALSSSGGGLTNHGVLSAEAPAVDGLSSPAAAAIIMFMFNLDDGRVEVNGGIRVFLDALTIAHSNRGVMLTMVGLMKIPPGEIVVKAGSQSTFKQEAGSIENYGGFICQETNTFEFTGGECLGNPIVMDGATLEVGPDAGPGAFDVIGPGNTIRADTLHNQLQIAVYPEATRPGGAGDATWEPQTPGFTPILSGEFDLVPREGLTTMLTLPVGLLVGEGGMLRVGHVDSGEAVFTVPPPYGIRIPASGSLLPGVIAVTSNTRFEADVDAEVGFVRTVYSFADGAPARGAAPVIVDIEGKYSQGGAATLLLQVNDSGVSDALHITGQASLGGALSLVLGPGYSPAWGDAWTPLTYASLTGDFAAFTTPALGDPNLRWWRSAGATAYTVGVRHVADTNHDGVVDFLDLNNVLSFFGQAAAPGSPAAIGDANTDGVVDFLDLNAVLSFFGTAAP